MLLQYIYRRENLVSKDIHFIASAWFYIRFDHVTRIVLRIATFGEGVEVGRIDVRLPWNPEKVRDLFLEIGLCRLPVVANYKKEIT